MVIRKNLDNGGSEAVEDIEWDALTVKKTCQEIEKRYLCLISAPDPATVRLKEVLEKALAMVQSSQKNYHYKCDQLKSICQDLTAQTGIKFFYRFQQGTRNLWYNTGFG
ncbi:SAC3 family protein A-like [Punica granatum]|uniref:SAC3 family protein A-like n=1 Tax=Punica granatum TaxID=22663 RepID=A0A6P8BYE0_PUNGR|nr:SAC3 family protein A-like [Punica granatum]